MKNLTINSIPMGEAKNYLGSDWEVRISKATADDLVGARLHPGYERTLRTIPKDDGLVGVHVLEVYNVSGTYFLGCCTLSKELWADKFDVTTKERAV